MLMAFLIILFVLMLLVGDERGGRSFITLILNILIMFGAIRIMAMGVNAFVIVLIASVLFTTVTLLYQNGVSIKSVAAIASVIIVMAILAVFAVAITQRTRIAGYNEIEVYEEITMYVNTNMRVRMDHVMICVVLLSLLGAIMDTSIAITSAVYEIYRNNRGSMMDLIKSGKNVGRDIMGTTVNTLLLASIGDTIMLNILYLRNGYSFIQFINLKSFFQEFLIIIFSNIGCLIIIPVSYIVVSYMLTSGYFDRLVKKSN